MKQGLLERVVGWIEQRQIRFVSGVPCSWLAPLIEHLDRCPSITYLPAANEALAVGHAAGAALAGCRPLVVCQNSGIGYLINPVTSLLKPYGLVCDFVISNRIGTAAEPQHAEMNRVAATLLKTVGITVHHSSDLAGKYMHYSECCAILLDQSLEKSPSHLSDATAAKGNVRTERMGSSRRAYFEVLLNDSELHKCIVTSTGYTSREVYGLKDCDTHFYMMGSMGCAAAIGLGIAMQRAEPVYVLDGDGAILMHLGEMATVGASKRPNVCHIIFNNGLYESTGGQTTGCAPGFACKLAIALGYAGSSMVDNTNDMLAAVQHFRMHGGPYLIECLTLPGSASPRVALDPKMIAGRFANALAAR